MMNSFYNELNSKLGRAQSCCCRNGAQCTDYRDGSYCESLMRLNYAVTVHAASYSPFINHARAHSIRLHATTYATIITTRRNAVHIPLRPLPSLEVVTIETDSCVLTNLVCTLKMLKL